MAGEDFRSFGHRVRKNPNIRIVRRSSSFIFHIMNYPSATYVVSCLLAGSIALGEEPSPRTTLCNPAVKFHLPQKPYVVLERAGVRAVVVDNSAVDDDVLPGHRAGYSGLASLTHARRPENLFVPTYAGLNFEHIHDGTVQDRHTLFEPRNAPMQLRVIDNFTCELYQAPTPHWKLESCLRYSMLEDGTIEMTLECIPRADTFANGYMGLFWASYIHQPESLDIHFKGHGVKEGPDQSRWIRGVTPAHGTLATHLAWNDLREFPHDEDFPLSLVFNRSDYRFHEPWYFGVSRKMAFVLIFRPADKIRMSQSPSGGGQGNPAWDFQYFVPGYHRGQRYQMVMRAMYTPFESAERIERLSRPHRKALGENK